MDVEYVLDPPGTYPVAIDCIKIVNPVPPALILDLLSSKLKYGNTKPRPLKPRGTGKSTLYE